MLLGVVAGLYSQFFVSLGIFNFTANRPERIELDALGLSQFGVDVDTVENDINRFVASANNAQQGTHFLLGAISGLIFSRATAGFSVGIIKELYDFIQNYRGNHINYGYFIDAAIDISFWFAGGFVGFYFLSALYDVFHHYGIHNPKGLLVFLGKKVLGKNIEISS